MVEKQARAPAAGPVPRAQSLRAGKPEPRGRKVQPTELPEIVLPPTLPGRGAVCAPGLNEAESWTQGRGSQHHLLSKESAHP